MRNSFRALAPEACVQSTYSSEIPEWPTGSTAVLLTHRCDVLHSERPKYIGYA